MKLDLGGTFRGRDAASTLAWVRPFLPRFGITRIANVTGLDRIGIPVWLCVRPNGRSLSVSQGKGVTAALAQASAVMESIEVYHAERVAPPDLVASYRTARRRREVVAPRALDPGLRWRAYHDALPIAWIAGTDLASGEPVLVPHARVNLDWSRPHAAVGLFQASSTGLASGNDRAEALCHAIYEVVERDAEWRWGRLPPAAQHARRVDEGSVDAPLLRGLLDRFAEADIPVTMWDITSDIGIPAYCCVITDTRAAGTLEAFAGSGCHLSKEVALARALTEAAQSRLTCIAGSRDDTYPDLYANPARRAPEGPDAGARVDFRARRSPGLGLTFDDDLATTLHLLRAAGFPRVVVVDHTRAEFGIPVVAVVVPGLHENDAD